MRYYIAVLVAILLLFVPWFVLNYPAESKAVLSAIEDAGNQMASIILARNPKTVAEIQAHYNAPTPEAPKVRVLIVPGHEPDYGGAEYVDPTHGHLYERNMTVELGQDLKQFLDGNGHYETFITRDTTAWNPAFASYFQNDWSEIIAWTKASHQAFSRLVAVDSAPQEYSKVIHNNAPQDVAYRLYGITKWADENNIDITIHIHFNDYPGHPAGVPGDHSGFAIYVPAAQYGNSSTSKAVAQAVFGRLSKYTAVSDLPGESSGIVDEPELIAIGANNTADAATLLIEYDYIYQPQFQDPYVRSMALKDLAFQTYLGLQDFFDSNNAINLSASYDTLLVPHVWDSPITAANASPEDVLALQTALELEGVYPPQDRSKNDCPRSGTFGPCTKAALGAFQKKYGITGESGIAGTKTISQLNRLYSGTIN